MGEVLERMATQETVTLTGRDEALRERVRDRYAAAARRVTSAESGRDCGCGCGGNCGGFCGTEASAEASTDVSATPAAACCGTGEAESYTAAAAELDETFGAALYTADEHEELPAEALAASLGCGNPTAVADLHEGEIVLDLGSGGGIDVLLSARRVGRRGSPTGWT